MTIIGMKKGPSASIMTEKDRYIQRWNALKDERSSWIDHWRDIATYISPRRSRFLAEERNKGTKKNEKIINGTPIVAHRTLASGMMAGITSPAREWFRLSTPDPDLAELTSVKSWLHEVEMRVRAVYAKSNFYDALSGGVYPDIGGFGTACAFIEEDFADVIRLTSLPVGSYCLGADYTGRIDTIYHECSYTVAQLVDEFGYENCSDRVQEMYDQKRWDIWIVVLHVVEPNGGYDYSRYDAKGKRYISNWYEIGGGVYNVGGMSTSGTGGVLIMSTLRESGYEEFPAITPRWGVTGEDIYGWCPAMDALGDCKALQLYERRKAQLVDKMVNPPMVGPTALKAQRASSLPGDITYVDAVQGKYEPAFMPQPNAVQYTNEAIKEIQQRINEIFFADLWLMISQSEQTQPVTAEEIRAKQEEKMLQLGPVLERLNNEMLGPAIERTVAIMSRAGLLPPPPPELSGVDVRIEFISVLAQAQKLVGTSAVERLAGFAGTVAQVRPDVLDNLDVDIILAKYADMLGVPPAMLRTDEVVAQVRAEKQKQQEAQQRGEAALAAAKGIKDAGDTNVDNLNQLLGQYAPAAQLALPPAGGSPGGLP